MLLGRLFLIVDYIILYLIFEVRIVFLKIINFWKGIVVEVLENYIIF